MKQFLYLDTDIVNSIIAQSEQGLIQSFSDEQVSSDTESDSSKIAANVNAKLGGSLAKLAKAEANLSGNLESMESNSSTATSLEIISKTMHDAAFNIAYNYINPIKVEYGNQSADDTGNYVEMKLKSNRHTDLLHAAAEACKSKLRHPLPCRYSQGTEICCQN